MVRDTLVDALAYMASYQGRMQAASTCASIAALHTNYILNPNPNPNSDPNPNPISYNFLTVTVTLNVTQTLCLFQRLGALV